MVSDYIDRQAALDALKKWSDGYRYIEVPTEYAINQFKAIPSADLEEIMIGGYPARHLAFVAAVMQKEGVPPEEVASCLRDGERMYRMIVSEQKEIIEETIRRMAGESDG